MCGQADRGPACREWRLLLLYVQSEWSGTKANILVNIEKGIEIGAEDALKWLVSAGKAFHSAPAAIAGLSTLVTALEKAIVEVEHVATDPLNIALDIQTANDPKAACPQVRAFLKSLGVNI